MRFESMFVNTNPPAFIVGLVNSNLSLKLVEVLEIYSISIDFNHPNSQCTLCNLSLHDTFYDPSLYLYFVLLAKVFFPSQKMGKISISPVLPFS